MSSGNAFIWGSEGHRSRSRVTKIAGVVLCTLVSADFYLLNGWSDVRGGSSAGGGTAKQCPRAVDVQRRLGGGDSEDVEHVPITSQQRPASVPRRSITATVSVRPAVDELICVAVTARTAGVARLCRFPVGVRAAGRTPNGVLSFEVRSRRMRCVAAACDLPAAKTTQPVAQCRTATHRIRCGRTFSV